MLTKKNLLIFSFLFLSISAFTQPINDDCSGLIDLGEAPICPAVLDTFNNVAATESIISTNPAFQVPACFNGGIVQRDVWFAFTVPSDGSILDFQIIITGVNGPNGPMVQPQVAVYRGDCLVDELQELDCASSLLGETELIIDLDGLTAGLQYFLRIEDWSATGAPNEGDFVLCIQEQPDCFNLCESPTESQSCEGKLYDSGGPDGNYSNNENCTFTICPSEFHQCIFLNVVEYNMENFADDLTFYAGEDTNSPQITSITGSGSNFEVQAASDCVTIQFTSDGSITDTGFYIEWMCSIDTCTVPPLISCDEPVNIPSLPFLEEDLSTCFAGNTVTTGPCNDFFLQGAEYIFTYDSPGDECIMIDITGSNTQTGVAVYNDCPNIATDCIAAEGGNFGQIDPTLENVFLEEAGTYYIVVGNAQNCTSFNINIESVECSTTLPPAQDCENALNINGCGVDAPTMITVSQTPSTNNNFQLGCWGTTGSNLFTWFVFQAEADGNFGFLASDANDPLGSDIDINVWGPFENQEDVCDGTILEEPIRSTWSGAQGATGLIDINPDTGAPVTDICENAGGDKYVSTIPVIEGEWYVVLVLDFGGSIDNGDIIMDFTQTSDGVLGPAEDIFSVTPDTVICPGETLQLLADGGSLYQWTPNPALSCVNCPDPVVNLTGSTTFEVAVFGACSSDFLEVNVGFVEVDAGPDLTVCLGEEFQIEAGFDFESITFSWDGLAGTLSCTNCPNPIITATTPGTYTYTVTVDGGNCTFSDEMILEVLNSPAPDYTISDNVQICETETVNLGGPDTGIDYDWSSFPPGFTSDESDPSVTPTENTTYYLQINNGLCAVSSFDSVFVEVSALPIAEIQSDTTICQDDSAPLSFMTEEAGVAYSWTPIDGLDDPNSPSPIATPSQTTTYTVIADRNGCANTASITVNVIPISVNVTVQDTFGICIGEEINLAAVADPTTDINWTPDDGSLNVAFGNAVVAAPATATQYFAIVEIDGCIRMDSVYIRVDSLPTDLAIMPADTSICEGEPLLLTSTIYEPALYQDITFQWSPPLGFETPDSLYNMYLIPPETTVYQRISTNGFCSDTTFVNVEVLTPGSITVDPVDPICEGDQVQLMASTPLMGDLVWDDNPDLSCTDCPNPIATPSGSGSASYTVTLEGFDCPVEAVATVQLIDAPDAFINDQNICIGESATLNPGGDSAYDYVWFSADDPTISGSTDVSPIVMPGQSSQYFVTVTNGACPDYIDSLTIFVADDVNFEAPVDQATCEEESVDLFFGFDVPGEIIWTSSNGIGGLSCIDCPNPTVNLGTAGTYNYTVSYSNECNVTASFDVVVVVEEGVVIESLSLDPELTEIYEGTPLTINSDVMAFDTLVLEFEWSTDDPTHTTQSILITPVLDDTDVQGGIATYTLTVTDQFGCTDFESISFPLLESNFEIPNAFTPNSDSSNDAFGIIITGENIEVLSFKIWNRWGKLIHEAKGTDHAWDGTIDGNPASSDVYIYSVELNLANGQNEVRKGDVTLIR